MTIVVLYGNYGPTALLLVLKYTFYLLNSTIVICRVFGSSLILGCTYINHVPPI